MRLVVVLILLYTPLFNLLNQYKDFFAFYYNMNNKFKHLISKFPRIDLSYEKNIYKKCQSNFYITIPKGLKYFAWFKYYNHKPTCFLLQINRKYKTISNISIFNCCFDKYLCSGKGTILYGTKIISKSYHFFNIEDIYFFKGINISHYNQTQKFKLFNNLLSNYIKQIIYTPNDIVFSMPIIHTNFDDIIKIIQTLPYDVYYIQGRSFSFNNTYLNFKNNIDKQIFANFLVKPNIQDDIYELFYYDNNKITFLDYALIPTFKNSVFMNSLFRNIKENENLDALEESDDEEEFENIDPDKFVYLDRSFKIYCVYNTRFKKWIPVKLAPEESKISSL